MISIKELDEKCRLNNYSIKYNRKKEHNGYKTFDYAGIK